MGKFSQAILNCQRCDIKLTAETPGYIISIKIIADWNENLTEASQSSNDLSDKLAEVLTQIDSLTAEELEASVYEQSAFIICGRCRNVLSKDPLGRAFLDNTVDSGNASAGSNSNSSGGLVH